MNGSLRRAWIGLTRGFRGRIGVREADGNADNADRTIEKWNHSDSAYSKKGFKCYWELIEEVQRYQAFMMANGNAFLMEGK